MTDAEAIEFLKTVQPLPDDSQLSEELIGRFDDVRKHFVGSPNEAAVPLLLNSFGVGDGLGVHQLVEDAIASVDPEKVIVHLVNALASPCPGVRYWVGQISANYNDLRLVTPLMGLLHDESVDTRMAALTSIEKYANDSIVSNLRRHQALESDREVLRLYNEIISSVD